MISPILGEEGSTYQVEHESVSTTANRLLHTEMRHSRCCVYWRQHEVNVLPTPPFMPYCLIRLPLRHPLPLLITALFVPMLQQACPHLVSSHVLHPEVVQVFERTGYLHVHRHLTGTRIVGLAGAEILEECSTAVGCEKVGADLECEIGRRGCNFLYFMALASEGGDSAFESASTGGGGFYKSCNKIAGVSPQ